MTGKIAYCGLLCETCPIHLATGQENREEQARMRNEIVRLCQEHYGMNYALEDITDCDGCRTETGRLFTPSGKCPIRKCAMQKGLETCAYCADYACGALEAIFKMDPAARARLDTIRSGMRLPIKS
jgi:hypothetical protein